MDGLLRQGCPDIRSDAIEATGLDRLNELSASWIGLFAVSAALLGAYPARSGPRVWARSGPRVWARG